MKDILNSPKLHQTFYLRNVVEVARELLGKTFVRKINNQTLAGTIVEVEAYDVDDAA